MKLLKTISSISALVLLGFGLLVPSFSAIATDFNCDSYKTGSDTEATSKYNICLALKYVEELNTLRARSDLKSLTREEIARAITEDSGEETTVDQILSTVGNGKPTPAVKVHPDLTQWAQTRANELAKKGFITHVGMENGMPAWANRAMFNSPAYESGRFAPGPESLAFSTIESSPVDMWLSELTATDDFANKRQGYGHYLTMVSPLANAVGFGVAQSSSGHYFYVLEISYIAPEDSKASKMQTVDQARAALAEEARNEATPSEEATPEKPNTTVPDSETSQDGDAPSSDANTAPSGEEPAPNSSESSTPKPSEDTDVSKPSEGSDASAQPSVESPKDTEVQPNPDGENKDENVPNKEDQNSPTTGKDDHAGTPNTTDSSNSSTKPSEGANKPSETKPNENSKPVETDTEVKPSPSHEANQPSVNSEGSKPSAKPETGKPSQGVHSNLDGVLGKISSSVAAIGQELTIEVSGLTKNGDLEIEFHSKVISLGMAKANALGNLKFTFKVPNVDAGKHHVMVKDLTTKKVIAIPVTVEGNEKNNGNAKTLVNTGVNSDFVLILALAFVGILGLVIRKREIV